MLVSLGRQKCPYVGKILHLTGDHLMELENLRSYFLGFAKNSERGLYNVSLD